MLVFHALGRIFITNRSVYILYQVKADIIYFVPRGYKMCHFMRNLRIIGFKTDAPYNTVYFRCTICS